jgi:hypothetical protein
MEIYCSSRSANSATVHFFVPDASEIQGTLRGPFCKYSHTLPSTLPIRDGKAIVVDPCYWSPRLPFRYEIKLTYLTDTGKHEFQAMWGIRWCVPHRGNLLLDGKGYVLRAVEWRDEFTLESYREHACALLTQQRLSPEAYELASELGVVVVDTDTTTFDGEQSTQAIALKPAVHALHRSGTKTDALSLSGEDTNLAVRILDEVALRAREASDGSLSILAQRKRDATSLSDMRRECDKLQSDLASVGQFSGYLITTKSQ